MDRARRFIWELDCGTKDRKLFKKAIAILDQLVSRTHDLSLLTDGERRYGNSICEVSHWFDQCDLNSFERSRSHPRLKPWP